jgi:C-terminal processing protease CtpA/Prc
MAFSHANPLARRRLCRAGAAVTGKHRRTDHLPFTVFLDYGRERIVLEPVASFGEPFTRASAGLSLHAEGEHYTTFAVDEVLEDSPAAGAGLRPGDVIAAIDGRSAAALTLTTINGLFETSTAYTLTIRRGGATLTITLTPRVLF